MNHRKKTDRPENYNTHEVQELHQTRLLGAYEAYCARVPKGFNPVPFSSWAMINGASGTLWADKTWQAPRNRRIEESNG